MHAVPKMGPPGGPIFGTVFRFIFVKFFASGLKKRNVLVSTEALWLMASGKATWVTVPNIYAFCLNKRSCIFVRTGRLFWFPCFLQQLYFCSDGSAFAVDFVHFCKVFCIRVEEAQCFGVNRSFVAYGERKGNLGNCSKYICFLLK